MLLFAATSLSPTPSSPPLGAGLLSKASSYNELVKAWGPVLIGVLAILATFGAQLLLIRRQRQQFNSQSGLERQRFELSKSVEERGEIIKKLNSFYGPVREMRAESVMFYRRFAIELQKRFRDENKRFRTLRYLLQKGKFDQQDQELLSQILLVNDRILSLIEKQSGVVDSPELQKLLGKLGAHIRILKLASEGKLSGPSELFEDVVFPLALDGALESATLRLQDRLKELTGAGTAAAASFPGIDPSVNYYDENADAYASQTRYVDMSDLYPPFRELVSQGGRILDAGCGVGRDTRYFIEHGYSVISFDASREMVKKCQEYPHAYCLHLSFEDLDFEEVFDGVWACASLLHLPSESAKRALAQLTTALKPGGIIFLSLRQPRGERQSETARGRFYQYYTRDKVEDLLSSDFRLESIRIWETTSNLDQDPGLWINALARKRSDVIRITS